MKLRFVAGLIIMLIAIAPMVSAEGKVFSELENVDLNNMGEDAEKVLEYLDKLVGNQIIQITITDTNETIWVDLKDGKINELQESVNENATLYAHIRSDTIEKIKVAEDPATVVIDAFNAGEIEYGTTKEAGIFSKVMIFISKIFVSIVSSLGKLF